MTRVATILTDKNCLRPLYGLLFGMPGVPAVYYGSEWGVQGDKKDGDPTLRHTRSRVWPARAPPARRCAMAATATCWCSPNS